jgi:hypothetical protein
MVVDYGLAWHGLSPAEDGFCVRGGLAAVRFSPARPNRADRSNGFIPCLSTGAPRHAAKNAAHFLDAPAAIYDLQRNSGEFWYQ